MITFKHNVMAIIIDQYGVSVLHLHVCIILSYTVLQSNGLSQTSPIQSQESSQDTSSASIIPPSAMKKKMSVPGTLPLYLSVSII